MYPGRSAARSGRCRTGIVTNSASGKVPDQRGTPSCCPAPGKQKQTMLVLDRVSKTYPNGVHALGGVSTEVELGEIVAVIGGSGCGKSTLLRAISGLDPAI